VGNIVIGLWMHEAIEASATQARAVAAYQLHKSIGLSVLALSVVRLGWRLAHPVPALPTAMPGWEKLLARATHWAFYVLMIAIPLAGWVYVSTAWSAHDDRPLAVPTLYFGLFRVPHLFGLEHAAIEVRRAVAESAIEAHEALAFATLGLFALHVAAALKHHFFDRDAVLAQMTPGLKAPGETALPRDRARAASFAGAIAALFIAGCGVALAIVSVPLASPSQNAPVARSPAAPTARSPPQATSPDSADAPRDVAQASAPGASPPPAWRVDARASEIAFAGVHAGIPFRGRFARWRADIAFDPDNLAQSRATVTIEVASASDGVSLHDESLPQAEWFDAARHPTAIFRTTRIRRAGQAFAASGVLIIKGRSIPIDLPFTLTITGDRARMDGRARIDRAAADLGMESDPDAEYVSREIVVEVHVEATRAR
jgi:cytochrome b561